MDSRADTSSPTWMPVFDVHYIHQDGQDWSSGRNNDEANAPTNAQHAAGSMGTSPLPSPCPPTPAVYSFDQWTALLDTDRFPNIYASRYLGLPNSGPSSNGGFQDSELSSSYSSTPPLSMSSPPGDDVSPYLTSPDQLFPGSYSPFSVNAVGGGLDLVVPVQHSITPLQKPMDESYSTTSGLPLPPLVSLSGELITTDLPSIVSGGLQSVATNDTGALPGDFIASPTLIQATALGLYYPDATLCLDVPPLPAQVEDSASALSDLEQNITPPAPSPVRWTFRAVDPSPKTSASKRARGDKTQPPDEDPAPSTDASRDADDDADAWVTCKECGYVQSKRRMGDFRRHLKKHDAEHLTRVICCGVPPTHPAAASLRPGHLTHWYGDRPFHGGCGRSYSRMDALQRHLKKSQCVGGSTKDHQSWRKLYFSDKSRFLH